MDSLTRQKDELLYAAKVALGFSVAMVFIHVYSGITLLDKSRYSIYPRDISQWYGIITGHFLHSSWSHLFSNLAPLLLTIFMVFFFYRSIGWAVFSLIMILTGFAVFMFARESSHLGASGLVYGLISFLFFSGLFRRNPKSLVIMVIVTILYGGYSAGLIPSDEKVSWESHLFGALSGLWTAFIFRHFRETDEYIDAPSWAGDSKEKSYYFERDVFDKTIAQRKAEEEERIRKMQEEQARGFWDYPSDRTY